MIENFTVDDVFGIQRRGDINHYVSRDHVDLEFLHELGRDKHICIYGSSKQGKTSLRRKHISDKSSIIVACDPKWAIEEVFGSILKAAGCTIQISESVNHKRNISGDAGIGAKVKIPLVAELTGKIGGKGGLETSTQYKEEYLPIKLNDINDVLAMLRRSTDDVKYVILEESHYLAEDVQRDFAFKLKAVHEQSDYVFIIVG